MAVDISSIADPGAAANAADYADMASSAAQKAAKFAQHARDMEEEDTPGHKAASHNATDMPEQTDDSEHSKSALHRAWDASKSKFFDGAMMFAGFAVLLTAMSLIFGLGASTLGGWFGLEASGSSYSSTGMGLLKAAAGILGATATGALWLGGGEFKRKYQQYSHEEDRLRKTFDGIDKGFGKAKETLRLGNKDRDASPAAQPYEGELSVTAHSLSSHLGGTAILVAIPEQEMEYFIEPRASYIETILSTGPRPSGLAVLERGSLAELSPRERIELSRLQGEELRSV